jgi:hypothetical protein
MFATGNERREAKTENLPSNARRFGDEPYLERAVTIASATFFGASA